VTAKSPLPLRIWQAIPADLLPFADAVEGLPLARLLRLALVQVSVGMALTLLNGTLNRVMIVEIGVPAGLVSAMIALPLLIAPVRALIGFKSDTHKSVLGWRRVPYIWMGTMAQFGGLALIPMALMLMGNAPTHTAALIGEIGALFAFFLVGVGLHTEQTAALALACDAAPEDRRPRVVALMYVALLLAMVVSALVFGWVLDDFTPRRLFAAVSGAAMVTVALNLVALWKQEGRHSAPPVADDASTGIAEAWRAFDSGGKAKRLLVAVAFATMAFNMQDVLLEPYGGEILHLSVGATTLLTAIWAVGSLVGFWVAARRLRAGADAYLLAAYGALLGLPAFAAVIFSGALGAPLLFRLGAFLIGAGGGLASVSLLHAATSLSEEGRFGFAVGAWGAVQATSAGLAVLVGGVLRDWLDASGAGRAVMGRAAPYVLVYHVEIALLFATLVALGPLVSRHRGAPHGFTLTEFPA
jgi:BCD family chlorophyll transporter-like MFS transporter